MRICFWGTRGSLPKPGPTTLRYGGNTSCVEVRTPGGACIVFDCGTGAQALGQELMAGPKPVRGHLFIGHTHWDHIQGLPFFSPLFVPGNEWDIYAPKGMEGELQQTLAGQMQYTYFPVPLDSLGATLRYHELLEQTVAVEDALITSRYLNHPALTLGYRVEVGGATFAYVTDHEPHGRTQACGRGQAEGWHHPEDSRHLEFIRGVDLLVHDAQYTAAEYPSKIGWGHSTVEYLVDIACDAGVKRLGLFHHDPMRTDEQLDRVVEMAQERAARLGSPLEIFAAAERESIELAGRASRRMRAVGARPNLTPVPLPAELSPPTRGQRVALAIRHEPTARLVREALAEDGLVATEIGKLSELPLLAEEHPALVIIEHGPGAQDGMEYCRELRAMTQYDLHDVPIVLVVDATHPEDLARGYLTGVTDWLVRPFNPAHVRTKARAWMLRSRLRWSPADLPANEIDRIAALEELDVLRAGREERFDRIARIAARVLDVPVSAVNLINRDQQVCKGMNCEGPDILPRAISLCAHTILGRDVMVIPDSREDERFGDNLLFTKYHYRFYAGVPLRTSQGHAVGTLCLFDSRPRHLQPEDHQALEDLAVIAQRELQEIRD
ncbi:MBL fold metallo-hydrolase [Hyalangium minutum]|nr:MBL fold metallo-hydrolase [Hyalangium minutum]